MLSVNEKRFIRHWENQRKGGRWAYYLLYIIVGTFICTLILSIFLLLFFRIGFGTVFFWIVFAGGLILSSLVTISSWHVNEKKFRNIIRREVSDGQSFDNRSI